MSKNILICGVGGQGTVLAAKLVSQAAVTKGEAVLSAETIGMAQRGGSVTSHVRIGSDAYSPLIPKGVAFQWGQQHHRCSVESRVSLYFFITDLHALNELALC